MSEPPPGFDPSDWKAWPHTAWALRNVGRFLPTTRVSAAADPVPLPLALEEHFGPELMLDGERLSWPDYLRAVHATAAIVIRDGRIVLEQYLQGATPSDRHCLFSITKTLVGLVALILSAHGELDLKRDAATYVPELRGTAFGRARLSALLAMRDGVSFDETYADSKAEIHAYSRHYWGGAPGGTLAALRGLSEREVEPGRFAYRTPVADVVGWALRRATGKPLAVLISELIWQPIGAEADALMILDTAGDEIAGTGFNARPRDLARLALALLGPETGPLKSVADPMFKPGIADAISDACYTTRPGWAYSALTWSPGQGQAAAIGVHGQRLLLDRSSQSALILCAAARSADTRHFDAFHAAALETLRDELTSRASCRPLVYANRT
jgi:6-aminohexanoate-oligomer exohydrolase